MAEQTIQPFSLAEYDSIAEHNGDVFFHWDLRSDKLSTKGNWFDLLGFIPEKNNLSQRLLTTSRIHPHDLLAIKEYLDTISFTRHDRANCTYYEKIYLRIKNSYGHYIPCKAHIITRFSDQNLPLYLYGRLNKLSYADEAAYEQKHTQEKDTLTGLFQYSSLQALLKKYIQTDIQKTPAVLFAVKLYLSDSFERAFNDVAGDAIVADSADTITHFFQNTDFICRYEQMTFLIFCRNLADIPTIKKKALRLINRLSYTFTDTTASYTINASVGLALYPSCPDFETLLATALQAQAQAWTEKTGYLLANPSSGQLKPPTPIVCSQTLPKGFFSHFIDSTYKILASNDNVIGIVNLLLGIIGRHFDLSRVFIYQQDTQGRYYLKTFEWCAAGIRPIGRDFSKLSVLQADYLYRKLSRSQLYSCSDIRTLPVRQQQNFASVQVKSFLRSRFRKKGQNLGCIGFDDCAKAREWTMAEQDYIRFVAEIILNALFSSIDVHKIQSLSKQLTDVLNFLPVSVYIVEPQNLELLFTNTEFAKNTELQNSMHCYERIYGQTEQCPRCPLKNNACQKIDWQGRAAYLIHQQHQTVLH